MPMVNFKLIIGLLLGLLLLVHGHHGTKKGHRESQPLTRRNRVERFLAFCMFLSWLILATLYLFSSTFTCFEIRLPVWFRWSGVVIFFSGDICLALAHLSLGRNWSLNPEIRNDHSLVVNGIYTRIRHPMYTAYILIGIGFLVSSTNLLIGLILLVPILVISFTRIGREERMLIRKFGNQYQEYKKRTGLLFPKIWFSKD